MDLVYLFIGIILGLVIGWLVFKKNTTVLSAEQINNLQTEAIREREKNENAGKQITELKLLLENENEKSRSLDRELARVNADYKNLNQKLVEQKAEMQELQEKFKIEFQNIANKILEEKSLKFTEQNKNNLDQILKPFSEKIKEFEEQVKTNYDNENKEKASLKKEIQMLFDLNQKMSQDAQNLTKALKGDTKTQGNWGEFILESILEKSGLGKEREYSVQQSFLTEEGKRLQPDVIIHLPEGKSLIIDSKVSLVAYDKYIAAEDEAEKSQAIKEHITSLRSHIKGLSEKNYQNLYQLKSLDFVLLFVPIEPAFGLAVQFDTQLFNDAFDKNIVVVSPTTLLATLRTVSNIWRQENHNRNAVEIARKAGDLYDKFNGFVTDLIDLGKKMDQSKSTYEEAMKKLSTGRGNIVNRVEELKKMGAITSKNLPQNLLERSAD